MSLVQSWRWYGPDDPVSLQDIKQAGATAVVTALHHIAHGEVWSREEISSRKLLISRAGLQWLVVESLPVHEAIKTLAPGYQQYLDNYCRSLENLAGEGIKIICYNFMPVLDWTRTRFDEPMPDGSLALAFNLTDLAVFDIYLLRRKGAEASYSAAIANQAASRFRLLSPEQQQLLTENILRGIPSEKDPGIEEMRGALETYASIGPEGLRNNLYTFLKGIMPVCTRLGIQLAVHPDDPPFTILGLPRILNTVEDFEALFREVPQVENGICFCTGSLGAGVENDLPLMLEKLASRVHFAHLRNVRKDQQGNFHESDHLDGDVDMYSIMKLLVETNRGRIIPIPFRPDHGHQMLDDLHKTTNPGYSAIGRLRGLAELRGLEMGIMRSAEKPV